MKLNLSRIINIYGGWVIIIILSLIPIIRVLQVTQLDILLNTPYNFFSLLGRVSSLVGMVLFSVNLMLSTRLKVLEKIFYGLNKVYVAHHIVGGISFILILLHPIFLAFRFVPKEWYQAGTFLIPSVIPPIDWTLNYGFIALYGMIILLFITFFVKLHYEFWLLTHKFLGAVFSIAIFHVFLVPSDVSSDLFLRNYMMVTTVIGLLAYIYVTLMDKILIRKYPYVIEKVIHLNSDVIEIVLEPIRHVIPYTSGQFVFLRFFQEGVPTQRHPFSVSSAPQTTGNAVLTVTIKKLGDFTELLPIIKPGTEVEGEGGFGKFAYRHATYKKQIWIAGGIGITPFLSMAQDIDDSSYEISLFYSVKTREELIGYELLTKITKEENTHFNLYPYVSEEQTGHLTAGFIADTVKDVKDTDIFICGPPPMMSALRSQFKELGVPNLLIHTEEFSID